MARSVTFNMYAERGETRTALWCDACHLPSRFEADLHLLMSGGVSTMVVGRCADCGAK